MKNFENLPFKIRKKSEDTSVLASQIQSLSQQISSGTGGSGGGVLVYNTLTDLQNAYPSGSTQPAWVISDQEWYYWSGAIVADTTPPTITCSSSGGTFSSAQTVTLSGTDDSGVTPTIYYTLDGSTPTTSSTVYSSALTISSTSTLKFFGKDGSGNQSLVQSVSFTITAADTTPPTITISPAAGTYTGTQTVTLSANETATIYYTLDGSTPTESSSVYSAPLSISATTTISYFGKDSAGNSSAVQTAAYTINVADTTPPVITASPAAGTYTSSQSVTLSSNETATIYYTTDGTNPTTSSTVYSAPISISATTTLQFIGKDTAGNISTPVAATYTINAGTAYVSDSFDRANNATSLGTTDSYSGGTNTAWTEQNGWGIANNKATQAGGVASGIAYVETSHSDCSVQADITWQSNGGILMRLSDASNYIFARISSSNVTLFKMVGGTATAIGTAYNMTPTAGTTYTLKITGSGSNLTVYVNDTSVITASDTFNQTATMAGLREGSTTYSTYDNFKVTA